MKPLLSILQHALTACLFALAAFFCSPSIPASGAGVNWPQWRGYEGSGVSSESDLPTEWSPTKNVSWRTPIPGTGHSSPIVWGKKIFLTTAIEGARVPRAIAGHPREGKKSISSESVGADHVYMLSVLCLDSETGKILWDRTAYKGTVYDGRHLKNTYASSTPVTDGSWLYAFFESEGLYCYDFNGKLMWKASLGGIGKDGLGPGTSPVLYKNLVILQCDQDSGENSFLAALDKTTGQEVWRVVRKAPRSWATPQLSRTAQRTELVVSATDQVIAYDPATGSELWRCKGVRNMAIPTPVTGHNMVFLSSAEGDGSYTMAIRLGGSGDLTETPNVVWQYNKGAPKVPSPILCDDYLYLMTNKGIVTCLNAKTGEVIYQGGRVPVPATFIASLVAFNQNILLTSEDGETFMLKMGPTFEILRTNSIGEPVYASPAISNGKIFIRGERSLYCISEASRKAIK
jgi:outer membrane protein assembly factor BamB